MKGKEITHRLNTGALMPALGMGGVAGFTKDERELSLRWFITALEAGYRHFDTAWLYGTEKYIAEAIAVSGIPREEIWITTKLAWHHPGLKSVEESLNESLNNLKTDYVDLYLIHWPQVIDWPDEPQGYLGPIQAKDTPNFCEIWADMEKLYYKGKAKNIGVSNFSIKTLEELLKGSTVVPVVNQIEMHPYLVQEELKKYCVQRGISVTAYGITGNSSVLNNPVISRLANKYHASAVQVIISWQLARNVSTLVKSTNKKHQIDNLELPDIEEADVQVINSLDRGERFSNKPDENGIMHGWTIDQLGW